MPKLKTSKSAAKRFKISGKGKLMRRAVNNGHFNAKSSGSERLRRHGVSELDSANLKDIKNLNII